jgi:hypothetical protein
VKQRRSIADLEDNADKLALRYESEEDKAPLKDEK